MNFIKSGQNIKMLRKLQYFGLLLDGNLSFKYDLDTIKLKLNKENCSLSKIRYFVRAPLLRAIQFTIFDPHFKCGCQIWRENENYDVGNIEKNPIQVKKNSKL